MKVRRMRAHWLQHVPFEGLGSIGFWLERNGYDSSCSRLFASAELPEAEDIDLLVVMGGPMSVNDEHEYPWLVAEKRFIRRFIESGGTVLGVCLGAQLIASAMGAKVYPNPAKEIGWLPVQAVPTANSPVFPFPPTAEVFHWHGETFDLPPGAIRLARSAGCENQAFQLGRSVIGLQFHLEMTPAAVREMVVHCRHELVSSTFVQTEEEILAQGPDRYAATNRLMAGILAYLQKQRPGRG